MKRNILAKIAIALIAILLPAGAMASGHEEDGKKEGIDAQGIIFEHLGDGYGWEVPFNHHKRIPLPVIVWGSDGLHVFSSSRVTGHANGGVWRDGNAEFKIAGKDSPYKGKVVEIIDGKEVKPAIDISITKNVCGIFIAVLLVIWAIMSVARWHKTQGMKGPRKMTGAVEFVILFIYDGVIKPTLKDKAPKFAPYLLTVFFFILVMNLLGLIVIFPGGANLTGNIAVTLVLAILTFFITNIFATKHYWKEIFNPDVPWWLKYPLPIMPIIEIFGVFTKPAALTVRLFANMMGGHMIVIVLTLLIFIFAAMGPVVTGATAVVSVIFSVFMLCIDVLVSFIQAYVFTMLSTLFIALGQEEGHHEKHEDSAKHGEVQSAAPAAHN
ncbi:MAG: F0F1 ATP synthase subunit A [Muribaculaceae bacterium]|jgi:F-type H+-transporting ATPase subunit a|nr:F0F1 ATP synthase subunit A [Muribaculaceae bacterium]